MTSTYARLLTFAPALFLAFAAGCDDNFDDLSGGKPAHGSDAGAGGGGGGGGGGDGADSGGGGGDGSDAGGGGGNGDAGTSADAAGDGSTSPVDAGAPVAVVVGYGGRRVMSKDGVAWDHMQEITANGGDDDDLFRGVCFGNGVFLAVGGSTHAFTMTSKDGVTWEHENRTPRAWMGNAAPLGTMFVGAGGNGLRMRSTDGGQTWVDDAGYQPIHYRDVTSQNGVVVAVGHNYDTTPNVGVIASTTDGKTWNEHIHAGEPFNLVASGNGVFVAAGPTGRVARSTDGGAWADVTFSATGGAQVTFTGKEFLVSFGDSHFTSNDGKTWVPAKGTRSIDGYFNGHYLSFDWPARIQASTDATQWNAVYSPLGSGFTKVAVGNVP